MVGDDVEADIEGAATVGMRAVLVDREGRYPERESLGDLRQLLAVL
jgi:FMN phosphatase YigB (HAD superfamily)